VRRIRHARSTFSKGDAGYLQRMRRKLLILALPLLLAWAGPGAAAEAPQPVGQYVDLQPVAMPIVIRGQLVNYVFVYVRINLAGGADVIRLRTREPFFRDALVREGHRTPFVVAGDWQRVDERKLAAALYRDAQAIAGGDAVTSVVVTSQSPQRRVIAPRS
jgi:hypothetical protein